MVPSNNVHEDRSAIRQALAILNQEGVFCDDDNDYDFESGSNEFPLVLDEELDVRPKKNKQRSRSKSPSRTRNMKEVPTVELQKSINPRIPLRSRSKSPSRTRNMKEVSTVEFQKSINARIPFKTLREDGSISSTSVSGNSSSSGSSHVDRNREVGGKTKRRSSNKINRRKNSQKAKQIQKGEKKSVRFSNFDHTVFIPHILDFTPEEIESIWMDEQEYRSIRSRSLTLIEMMEDEKKYPISADYMIVNKHLVCVRGLGEKTTLCTRELDRIQRKLYKAVFRTQEELREEGIIDPEAIRQASKKYSKKSLKTARFVGISDEVNVASKFG